MSGTEDGPQGTELAQVKFQRGAENCVEVAAADDGGRWLRDTKTALVRPTASPRPSGTRSSRVSRVVSSTEHSECDDASAGSLWVGPECQEVTRHSRAR